MTTRKATRNGRSTQDAIKLLKEDHRNVRDLLAKLESTTSRGARKREELCARIALEIRVHSRIEEKVFYPAYHEAARTDEDAKLFYEAHEEHAIAEHALQLLEEADPETEVFSARAKVLKDVIEHHADEEEKEMFPRAKKLLGERLVELGQEMAELKEVLKVDLAGSGELAPSPRRNVGRGARRVLRR